jgi:hypothetical protein
MNPQSSKKAVHGFLPGKSFVSIRVFRGTSDFRVRKTDTGGLSKWELLLIDDALK